MVSTNCPINREQVAVNFVAQKVAIETIWPAKNTLNFKNQWGDPHFLLWNCNQHDKIQLFAKFKKVLWRRFRATLNFRNFEVDSIIFSHILNYCVHSLYSHTNSYDNAATQCNVDGSQRSLGYLTIWTFFRTPKTRFLWNVFEPIQKSRRTCFIGSKNTRLRLSVRKASDFD